MVPDLPNLGLKISNFKLTVVKSYASFHTTVISLWIILFSNAHFETFLFHVNILLVSDKHVRLIKAIVAFSKCLQVNFDSLYY